MPNLKTEKDLEKKALALVKSTSKAILNLSMSPLSYRDQDSQIANIRKAIDKAWDICQFLGKEQSNNLDVECKNMLSALAVASKSASGLMGQKRAEERQALAEAGRTSDRYLSELAGMYGHR